MWLLVLSFLSLVCIGNSVAVYLLWRKKQHQELLHAKQTEQYKNALKILHKRLETYAASNMRMGQNVDELQKKVAPLPDKILRLELKDPGSLSFTQAARLIGLGATAEDLKQSCGLSQSEAELLQRMHSKK
ncbi:MAG: DUF2802 domain-containing protein [Pseudomonas sp.]|nr:DUF2802 domain-containing protein [Pseudomonas sp.]